MAKQPQTEPALGLDRRQLLASAAALSVGNIAGVDTAHQVFNSGQAVTVAEMPTSNAAARNVCAETAQKIEEIAARNIIRAEARLPLLSIPKELRRMKKAADAMAFEEFADRHGESVWEEVLAPVREAKREPNWRPTGFMEGLGFQAQVSTILRRRFELSNITDKSDWHTTVGAIASFTGYDEAPTAARTWHVRTLSKR
jgi:hypothetical protein